MKRFALFDIFMHLSRNVYIRHIINRWNRTLQARSVIVNSFAEITEYCRERYSTSKIHVFRAYFNFSYPLYSSKRGHRKREERSRAVKRIGEFVSRLLSSESFYK